jgi:hypothetical protein
MASRYKALGRNLDVMSGAAGVGSPPAALADMTRRRDNLRLEAELQRLDAIGNGAASQLADVAPLVSQLQTIAEAFIDGTQLVAAWAVLQTDGAGGVTIVDTLGVTGAVIVAPRVRVTLARAMGTYTTFGHVIAGGLPNGLYGLNASANQVDVTIWSGAGNIDANINARTFGVGILGRLA